MNERIVVKRLPRQPGLSGWNALLPSPDAPVFLEGKRTADIAVIGGGFAGFAAARRLLQIEPGLKVAILEAGRFGEGPSGRNSGFMIDLPHALASRGLAGAAMEADREQTEFNRIAIRFAGEAVEEYGLSREAHDPVGKISVAASSRGEQHNRSYAALLRNMNEHFEMLDRNAMREVTGSDFYSSGLFTPGTAMFQPALYIRGMAKGLSATAALFENSPVLALERQQSDWNLITPKGILCASKLILAVNGHVESFGFFRRRLMHLFTFASLTRALSREEIFALGGTSRWSATPADPTGTTVRRISGTGGDRILIRRYHTYAPFREVADSCLHTISKLHDESFVRRFPQLKNVSMEYRWGGNFCLSRNRVPAFGEVANNVFSACCQNGLGASKGTLSGIAAAELALDQPSSAAAFLNRADPPERLPPEPLAWLGINAYFRYKRWRSAAER